MARPSLWTPAKVDQATAMREAGKHFGEIGTALGMSETSIRKKLGELGLFIPQSRHFSSTKAASDDDWGILATVASRSLARAIRKHHPERSL